MQLVGQNIEDYMSKRGFHAIPDNEAKWVVEVSHIPAYNLQAQMLADRAKEDEGSDSALEGPQEKSYSPRKRQPGKPSQQVHLHGSGWFMTHVFMCCGSYVILSRIPNLTLFGFSMHRICKGQHAVHLCIAAVNCWYSIMQSLMGLRFQSCCNTCQCLFQSCHDMLCTVRQVLWCIADCY